MKIHFVLTSFLILLAGCEAAPPSLVSETPTSPVASPSPVQSVPTVIPTPTPSPQVAPTPSRISSKGIGAAELGMTLGALKQTLGAESEFSVKSPFMVDFDAIAVSQSGKVQYYVLYLAGQSFTDSDVIQGLLTENPDFKTAEGIGAGTSIQLAEAAYGKATLSYNTQNESREYVRFERQPAPNISFSTGSANQDAAGIYASPTGEYNETHEFKASAQIKSVLIVCLSEGCTNAP